MLAAPLAGLAGPAARSGARKHPGIILERMMTPAWPGDTLWAVTYEITFSGEAGPATRAEFDDCLVTIGPGTTTLRAELPDQAALAGLVQRIADLRLELILVRLVTGHVESGVSDRAVYG